MHGAIAEDEGYVVQQRELRLFNPPHPSPLPQRGEGVEVPQPFS